VTASVRKSLLAIVHGADSHVVVPLQGSGTFSVEAAVATVVPREGHVLVLDNGAYCKRAAQPHTMMGRRCTLLAFDEAQPVSAAAAEAEAAGRRHHHPRGADPLRDRAPACSTRCKRSPTCASNTARA
jgi:aspartate aminotransferase-like enzyme